MLTNIATSLPHGRRRESLQLGFFGWLCLLTVLIAPPGIKQMLHGQKAIYDSVPRINFTSLEGAFEEALNTFQGDLGNSQFVFQWQRSTSNGSIVRAYRQFCGSIPVRGGFSRLLATGDGPYSISLRSARYFRVPELEVLPSLSRDDAFDLATSRYSHDDLDLWTEPQQEWIVSGDDGERVRLVWSVIGYSSDPALALSLRYDIDATNGRCLAIESMIEDVDITGTLSSLATPGTLPDVPGNPEILVSLPNALVEIPGFATGVSNSLGEFVLSVPPASNWPVEAQLSATWGEVIDSSSSGCTGGGQAIPGQPIDLILNSPVMEHDTSEVNVFLHTDRAFRFFTDNDLGFPAIQAGIQCNVNVPGICNAYYNIADQSLNFFEAGAGCVNAAYSTVITHEFGHYLVNQLGVAQGAFGEGFSDTFSVIVHEDPIVGRDFLGPGSHIRNIATAGVTYPCFGEIHDCGQMLAGFWWDLLEILRVDFGQEEGWERTAALFSDWASITSGGFGGQPLHEFTVQEILSIDDDDSDLTNGTTHYWQIREAALARNINVPPVVSLIVEITDPIPQFVNPNVAYPIGLSILDGVGTYLPGSGILSYRYGSGVIEEVPLQSLGGPLYQGILPPSDCGSEIQWAISLMSSLGNTIQIPSEGMFSPFRTPVGEMLVTVLDSQLETSTGWQMSAPGDSAISGLWEHGIPIPTLAQSSGDHSEGAGFVNCFATGLGVPGGLIGDDDVDGGVATLTSPPIPIAAGVGHRTEISYWRWYVNDGSAAPVDDSFKVECTSDGGLTWNEVEILGPGSEYASGGWEEHLFWLDQIAPQGTEFQLRFIASDLGIGNIVEAAIDDLRIRHLECSPTSNPVVKFRRGDCNADGGIDVSDPIMLFEHLFGSATQLPCADSCDVDDGGILDLQDGIVLLQAVFGFGLPLPSTCEPDPTDDLLECLQGTACP